MLKKKDLRLNHYLFHFASIINIYPITFDAFSGQIQTDAVNNETRRTKFKSAWKRIIYKFWQSIFVLYLIFISIRTAQFAFGSAAGGAGASDRDFLPFMYCQCVGYYGAFIIAHLIFDRQLRLNSIVYDEIHKIRFRRKSLFLEKILKFKF
jgi:hypothetical protein